MQMTIHEFESKFFDQKRFQDLLENRVQLIQQYKDAPPEQRWTTYFMLLGILAAAGRLPLTEYQAEGPAKFQRQEVPTPERLYTLTALCDLLK